MTRSESVGQLGKADDKSQGISTYKDKDPSPSANGHEKPAATPVLPIYRAIPAITGEVAPIAKGRKNEQQGYKFRGIEDVYAHLNLLLAKYCVSIFPTILESLHEQFTTKNGAAMFRHRVRIRYKLTAGDGSSETADVEGEGMDTGDKATPKAFSTAYKTMAFGMFCIPTGEKVDSEEDSPEVAAQPPEKPFDEDKAEAIYAEFVEAFAQATDAKRVGEIATAIKRAHEGRQLTDDHRKKLLKVYGERVAALAPKVEAKA